MTELVLAVQGKLGEFLAAERETIRRKVNQVVRDQTTLLKNEARQEVNRSFEARGRRRVANAIRGDIFQNRDGTSAGLVYSKFGRREGGRFIDYFALHETGGTVRARNSKYMFIPVKGTSRRVSKARRDLANLGQDPKLAIIPASHGGILWFVRKTSKRRFVLIGILVRRTRHKKRLNFNAIERRGERRFFQSMAAELARDN